MILDDIQNRIIDIYKIDLHQKAQDYLIDRGEVLYLLESPPHHKIPKELLLSRYPSQETVEVALFLDPELLQSVEKFKSLGEINENNLADFCIIIEGISHFVYFLWKANKGYKITQVEMELQAEIDKFLILYLAMSSAESSAKKVDGLFSTLFEEFHLYENMSEEPEESVNNALGTSSLVPSLMKVSQLAMHYCHKLHDRFLKKNLVETALQEARQFYQLGQADKIRFINTVIGISTHSSRV